MPWFDVAGMVFQGLSTFSSVFAAVFELMAGFGIPHFSLMITTNSSVRSVSDLHLCLNSGPPLRSPAGALGPTIPFSYQTLTQLRPCPRERLGPLCSSCRASRLLESFQKDC